MALYFGVNLGTNLNGTGSTNGVVVSNGSFAADLLLIVSTTSTSDLSSYVAGLEQINMELAQTGSWPVT